MLNLKLFHKKELKTFKKEFEATKNIKILKFKGHWANSKLAFVSKENPLKNTLGKIKKSKKVRQYRKALIPAFANFLRVSARNLFLQVRLDGGLCPHAVLRFCYYSSYLLGS